ncbi:MAG TPA: TIGR03620 family F420-dependent LLM class oxidoreductase [Amycolatopsis sp.]|nr:TIGR03620 family F420-dependent LLM class oxidoreductase [Amycolatopsis sp.]
MTTPTELRQALGRLGIWMHPRAARNLDPVEFARKTEEAGFRAVWVPGVDDAAALDALEPILAGTTRLVVATGIANIWTWEPADLAARADRLAEAFPGRFILGLGNSHAPRVEQTGQAYLKPYSKTVSFLDELPSTRAPVVLAALGPKMLALSRDRTLGAYPYFNPPEHVEFAREILGPDPLLVSEVGTALATGAEGEAHARGYAKGYLRLPNYTNNLRRFGFTDEDLGNGGSERLLDTIAPHGPEKSAERIRQHLDAGADHVVVHLVGDGGRFAPQDLGQAAELLSDLTN